VAKINGSFTSPKNASKWQLAVMGGGYPRVFLGVGDRDRRCREFDEIFSPPSVCRVASPSKTCLRVTGLAFDSVLIRARYGSKDPAMNRLAEMLGTEKPRDTIKDIVSRAS
jgi:hypothetical protein